MNHPLEKLPKESARSFAAFQTYAEFGPQRSLTSVARALAKSEQLMKRWSARFDWPARAAAYDTRMAEVEQEMKEIALRAKAPIWAERTETLRERSWSVYESCIAAAEKALARFVNDAKAASLGEIARMLEVATKLGCLATGLAADRVAVVGDDGGPVKVEFLAALERAYGDAPALTGGGEVVDVEIDGAAGAAGGALLADGAGVVIVAPAVAARPGAL